MSYIKTRQQTPSYMRYLLRTTPTKQKIENINGNLWKHTYSHKHANKWQNATQYIQQNATTKFIRLQPQTTTLHQQLGTRGHAYIVKHAYKNTTPLTGIKQKDHTHK